MELPFVTIAVPCLDEEAYIEECVRGLCAQDYPSDRFEIIVADGGSRDRTREILARLSRSEPRISVIDNPGRIQAAGLNRIIAKARGEIVVRADVHADYAPDYVRACVEVLAETGADNVGGAARPKAKNAFQRALAAALESPLSFGGSKYRDARNEGWVESVFPGAFRRAALARVGGFDPHAITNEDAEINQRIWATGGRVWLSRRVVVHYYPRESFQSLARQYYKYGFGRARTLLKHKKLMSLRPALPFLALTSELTLSAVSPLLGASALGAYALLTGAEAIRVGRRVGVTAIPTVWAIFPVLHVSHAIGFARGIVHYTRRPDWIGQALVGDDAVSASTR